MAEKVKVQVNRLPAFIPLDIYIKYYGKPTTVFEQSNLDLPVSYYDKAAGKVHTKNEPNAERRSGGFPCELR